MNILTKSQAKQFKETGVCMYLEPMALQPIDGVFVDGDTKIKEDDIVAILDHLCPYTEEQRVTIGQENINDEFTKEEFNEFIKFNEHQQAIITDIVDVKRVQELDQFEMYDLIGSGKTDPYKRTEHFKKWFNKCFSTPKTVLTCNYNPYNEADHVCFYCKIKSWVHYIYDNTMAIGNTDINDYRDGEEPGDPMLYKDKPLETISNPFSYLMRLKKYEKDS